MRKNRRCAICAVALAATVCSYVQANDDSTSDSFEVCFETAVADGDFRLAHELIEAQLSNDPDSPILLYNSACIHSRLGKLPDATTLLLKAVQNGFHNFSHMRRDPDLASLRGHPIYRALLDARDAADTLLAERRHNEWRQKLNEHEYKHKTISHLKLDILTSLVESEHQRMQSELELHAHSLLMRLFEATPLHWVLIVVPTDRDLERFLSQPGVHGVYRHLQRELIVPNNDSSLRHELVHVLHHSDMDRRGQEHPMWIQEGLAALWEEYEIQNDGNVKFVPGTRHNQTKRLYSAGELIPWIELIAMNRRQFNSDVGRTYPQACSMFQFIVEQVDIGEWYRLYSESFENDRDGIHTLEAIYELSIEDIERRWLRWLDEKPFVIDQSMIARENEHTSRDESQPIIHGE